jgi:hypothetical protein
LLFFSLFHADPDRFQKTVSGGALNFSFKPDLAAGGEKWYTTEKDFKNENADSGQIGGNAKTNGKHRRKEEQPQTRREARRRARTQATGEAQAARTTEGEGHAGVRGSVHAGAELRIRQSI